MMRIDPAAWTAFCADPAEEHFGPFYEQSKGLVWTLCRRILRDEDEAQDAFQGVYARLLVHARQTGAAAAGDPSATIGRIIYQAAIREANRLRLRRHRRSQREVVMDALTPQPAGDPSARDAAAQAQARARIEALVAALPEKYRLPLELHFFHGMTQAEIAALIGRSQGNRFAAHRARAAPCWSRSPSAPDWAAPPPCWAPSPSEPACASRRRPRPRRLFSLRPRRSSPAGGLPAGVGGLAALKAALGAILEVMIVKAKVVALAGLTLAVITAALVIVPGLRVRSAGQRAPVVAVDRAAPPASTNLPAPGARPAAKSSAPVAGVLRGAVPGGAIVGRITAQETGRPIAGARIKVLLNRWVDQKKDGITDDRGEYRLAGLSPGQSLTIIAEPEDYAWQSRLVELTSASDCVRCDFALEPAGEVALTVTDPAGHPVSGAYVNTHKVSPTFNGLDIHTDTAGRARVRNLSPTHPLLVSVGKDGYVDQGLQEVLFPKGQFKVALRFVLTRRGTIVGGITGRVTDPQGAPLPGITVNWGYFTNSNATRTTTDAEGRYHLATGVPAQDIEPLSVCGKGWATQTRRTVVPGPPAAPVTVDFTMRPGHWLGGVVVDEGGRPLPGMIVNPDNRSLPDLDFTPAQYNVKTDERGRFRIEDLPDQAWGIRIYGKNYPSEDLTQLACDREHRIVLRPAGRIRGRVIDQATRRPVTNFTITQYTNTVHPFSSPLGAFTLNGLNQGKTYEFTISAPGYPPHLEQDVPVAAPDGGGERVIELPRGRPLRGILLDRQSGAPIAGAEVLYAVMDARTVENFSWGTFRENDSIKILERQLSAHDGAFTLHVGEAQGTILILPARHQRLMIRSLERKPYLIGETLVVKLPPAATLAGKAVFDGAPQGHAYIALLEQFPPSERGARRHHDTLDTPADGAYCFEGLKAGEYRMSMQRRFGTPSYQTYHRAIKLAEGEQKTLNIGGDLGDCALSGKVLDHGRPAPNIIIELTPQFEWEYTLLAGHSNDQGVYAIQGLRPGAYKAALRQAWDARKPREKTLSLEETIQIPAQRQHDFEFNRGPAATVMNQ